MPFPSVISAPQKTTLRASGFWQRTFVCFNPGEVVFQAEADEDINDAPFKEFAWVNTLQGAYTDVWQGMVVYISSTTSFLKDYKYRGRVRLVPSATVFSIDLNATELETGDIITVIRDADLFARVRENTLVDGSVAYHNLPPMTTGLPSVLVLYDSDNDGSVAWTPAQSGIAVASGATIASYAWAVSGTGSSSVSNAAAQNPNFTFAAGFHYLVRLTTTDSDGVSNYIIVQVYAVARTFTAPVILPAAAGDVHQDLDNGYTGSITAYGGVANLPYRTHAAVFCVERFGDASSTPIVTNVLMHGRLRSESITTEGSDEGGALQQVTYPIEGITAYMQRLKMPNDIVRHNAAPSEWGEITNPTPYRMAVYALFAYSTLLNLVSFSAGDSLFDAWRRGGEALSVDGGYALDVLKTMMGFVDAEPNYAPDGEIRNEITASCKVDRSALVTIMDFLVQDARAFTLDIDTSQVTAQVNGYGGMWNTSNNTVIYFTASAPTVPYSDAPEVRELTRLLLQHDSTTAEATAEVEARTANDYAVNNPKWLLSATLRDSHRWIVATNYQRYTWTLAAIYDLREIALTTEIKWQVQSVDITINVDGTYDVSAQFVQETQFLNAQSIGGLLPINLEGMNPIFPVLSDDLASPDDPLWMYPTDTPTQDELQPISAYSAALSYSPFTPDQAAQMAQQAGDTNCMAWQVLMRNPGTTNSPNVTVNAAPYTVYITGSGQIGSNVWSQHFNMVQGLNGWVIVTDSNAAPMGVFTPGTGVVHSDNFVTPQYIRGFFVRYSIAIPDLTGVAISLNITKGSYASGIQPAWVVYTDGGLAHSLLPAAVPDGNGTVLSWNTGGVAIATELSIQIVTSQQGSAVYTGAAALLSITLTGTGTNPFTLVGGGNEMADAYYRYFPDDDNSAVLFDPSLGLLLNSTKPAVIPPFNPAHEYIVPYIGDGNVIPATYLLTDNTTAQNRALTIQACRD